MTVQIEPTTEQMDEWIKHLIPAKDLFFLKENDLETYADYLQYTLVMPRKEFFNHSSYMQINYVNSYMYWMVSSEVNYVVIAHPSWISELTQEKRKLLLENQAELSTGLILPASILPSRASIPPEYFVRKGKKASKYFLDYLTEGSEEFLVLRAGMWKILPLKSKESIMRSYARMIDDWNSARIPETTPVHIRKYANRFPEESGSNCLSATLFAITGEEWISNEWVHPETFVNGLAANGYSPVNAELREGDVVTWVNANNIVQHASYHIENNLFFNKSGQTCLEPWKITHFEEIDKIWQGCEVRIYRYVQ